MFLKVTLSLLGLFLVSTIAHAQDNKYTLELTDGYFQTSTQQPVHLIDGEVSRQWIWLGDGVRLWYTLKLRDGLENPCDRRSKDQCITLISFISDTNPKGNWNIKGEMRIDHELSINFGIPLDRGKTPLGNGSFVFKMEKDGEILFFHEILVEIK